MWSHRTSCPRRAAAEGHGRASRSRPASDRNGWEADIRTRFPRLAGNGLGDLFGSDSEAKGAKWLFRQRHPRGAKYYFLQQGPMA
jgi:hypothetical protein